MNVYLMIFLSRLFAFSLISMSLFRLPAEGYDIFITRMANHSPNILLALPNANDIWRPACDGGLLVQAIRITSRVGEKFW